MVEFDVDIYLWEDWHFPWFDVWAKLIVQPPLGVYPASMYIEHPQLNAAPLFIDQVVIKNVTGLEQDDDGGLWCCTISFIQYRKTIPALAKVLEGPPGNPLTVAPPVDPEQQTIVALKASIAAAK